MTYAVVILCDGEPVIDPTPCHPYIAAEVLAGVLVQVTGRPVPVVRAVVDSTPSTEDPSLFDVLEDVA